VLTNDLSGSADNPAVRGPTAQAESPPKAEAGQRFRGFNVAAHGLRGLASVMVLLAHILGGTARHIYPHEAAYVRAVEHPWYFGTFSVEIFFVISGFVILPSALKYDGGEFALRRFLRIYPLFFTLSILFVLLNFATNAYPGINNARSIVSGLLFINLFTGTEQLTPNAWSLSFEACFYVLTGLIVVFAVRKRSVWLGGLAIVLALAFLVAFPITIFFLIGIAMRLWAPILSVATARSRAVELAGLLGLIFFASRTHFDYTLWSQFATWIVPGILVSISVYFFTALMKDSLTARALNGRAFRYLGDVSYSLYLVHPFAYFVLRAVFVHFGWFTSNVALSMGLFATAVIVTSLFITHFVHATLERWPYHAFFHQNVYRRRGAARGASPSLAGMAGTG
jgi:peptidoglycan/LPS O-acetylase OafA/YrhL